MEGNIESISDLVAAVDSLIANATPAPWWWGEHSEPSVVELADYMRDMTTKRDGVTAHMAFVPDDEKGGDHYLTCAITGNGPTSAVNAQLVCLLVNAWPMIRATITEADHAAR